MVRVQDDLPRWRAAPHPPPGERESHHITQSAIYTQVPKKDPKGRLTSDKEKRRELDPGAAIAFGCAVHSIPTRRPDLAFGGPASGGNKTALGGAASTSGGD